MGEEAKKRGRLAIGLRGLMVRILALGLLLGWQARKADDQRKAVRALKEANGSYHYDWEFVGGKYAKGRKPPGPDWLRGLVGDEYFQEVTWVNLCDSRPPGEEVEAGRALDRLPAQLGSLGRLRELHLSGRQLHDDNMARVRGLPALETLTVVGAENLSDAGVAHLRNIGHLTRIEINDCKLTDESLDSLADVPSLEELDLRGNRITDARLGHLSHSLA